MDKTSDERLPKIAERNDKTGDSQADHPKMDELVGNDISRARA